MSATDDELVVSTLPVILEVMEERRHQVSDLGYDAAHDDRHDRRSWAWYLGRRVHDLACPFDDAVLDERRQFIEVAAIALAAVESIDRRAAAATPPASMVPTTDPTGVDAP